MRKLLTLLSMICPLVLAGCTKQTGIETRIANYAGNMPDLDAADVKKYVDAQDAVMKDFARLAGITNSSGLTEWRSVVEAGIAYTDVRCDRFMDSLFWFNRVREGASRQIQYTGAAVGAALAVVEASKTAIGLTPLGFSLFDNTVNNLGAGLLFNLNPSTVRVLVEKKQLAYMQSLSASYTSKVVALQVIQNYAAICLPPSIETEVERAISDREYSPNVIIPKLPPEAADVTPDPFSFTDVPDAAPSTMIVSNPIIVQGIGSAAAISISNGEYAIGSAAFTTGKGTVAAGWPVRVKVTSSATAGDEVKATLDIGGVQDEFSVTTTGGAPAAGPPAAVQSPPQPEPAPSGSGQDALPSPNPQ